MSGSPPASNGTDTVGNIIFSFAHQGVHFCGCNTNIFNPTTGTIDFHFSPELHRGLALELAAISPDTPLLIFSHAPLYRLFQPWQWWTEDSESLYNLLEPRKNVYLLHGHVHQNITLQLPESDLSGTAFHGLAPPGCAHRIQCRTINARGE